MGAKMVITHAPERYLPSNGMTPCGWGRDSHRSCATVGTPTVAVHVLVRDLPVAPAGTHLCAFHSPYDVRMAPVQGVSLAEEGDSLFETRVGVEVSRSGFFGHATSRIMTPGSALRFLEAHEGPMAVLEGAMLAPFRDVIMEDGHDEFLTWSARSVTVLPTVCLVDHDAEGFVESV